MTQPKMSEESFEYKYPNFITEQSNDIPFSLVCYLQKNVNRCQSIFDLDNIINDIKLSSEIEAGIFEYSLLYAKNQNYQNKLIPSIYNYTTDNIIKNITMNKELIHDMKNGMINPRMLTFLSPQQLNPKKWKDLLAKKQLKEEQSHKMTTTDIYKCKKCDQRKCTVRMMQTRSLDEPMTIFVKCCHCYNTWTMN